MARKIVKYLTAIPFLAILLCSCSADYSIKNYEVSPLAKYNVATLDENTMPISAWAGPDSSLGLNTNEQYQIVKEAGLNMIYSGLGDRIWSKDDPDFQTKLDSIHKSLQYCQNNDLLFFPVDHAYQSLEGEQLTQYFKSLGYENYSSFAGILSCDEPYYADFEDLKTYKDKFYSYYDDKYVYYVNLNPSYVDESYLSGRSYQTYLDDYVTITESPYFSYDHYPELGDFPNIRTDYFLNLTCAIRISLKRNVPFWSFVLASSHEAGTSYYRLPCEGEIYWQVSTALAYGSKGFQYFCYMTPNVKGYLGKPGSIVNEYGQKSTIFPYIQNANKAISYLDELLINATLIGLTSDGDTPAFVYKPFNDNTQNLRDVVSFNSNNGGLLSVFSYKNKTLYLLTSNNFQTRSTLEVKFSRGIIGNLYSFDGEKTSFKNDMCKVSLEPGKCLLLEVTN